MAVHRRSRALGRPARHLPDPRSGGAAQLLRRTGVRRAESLGAAVLNPTEAPHVGGLTPEAIESQALETVEQVGALTSGRRPHNAVNAERATRLARFGIDRTTAGGRATVPPAGADARGGGVRTLQSWLPVCRAFTQAADLLNIHSSASARSAKSSTRAVRPVSQLTWTDQPSPGLAWRASK
jgi:hypothetical protein